VHRNQAIVLKRHDFAEADRICTLFTLERGKVTAIAKGVRRIASRKSGHIELFTHATVLLAQGRNMDVLTQAETLSPFRGLRSDLLRTAYAYHVCELVERTAQEGVASSRIFRALLETLSGLCDAADPSLASRWFEIALLDLLGYRPQLRTCVGCGVEVGPEGNSFSPEAGGVLCPTCGVQDAGKISLDPVVFRVLRHVQAHSLDQVLRIDVSSETRSGLESILRARLESVLERRLRSLGFVQRLRDSDSRPQ